MGKKSGGLTPPIQTAITFEGLQLINLTFVNTFVKYPAITKEADINFEYEAVAGDGENPKHFAIRFKVVLANEKGLNLHFEGLGHFKTSEIIDSTFLESALFLQNAPAIAFPFFRASFATILMNAGYEPIILPSFNFAKGFQELKSTESKGVISTKLSKPPKPKAIPAKAKSKKV